VAARAVEAYRTKVAAAYRARNRKAVQVVQSGSALTLSWADFRVTRGLHRKATVAVQTTTDDNRIPPSTPASRWFMSLGYSPSDQGDYLSLYQPAAGGAWRKSLEVWLGTGSFPEPDVDDGLVELPTAGAVARERVAVSALAHYLSTGHQTGHLADVSEAKDLRAYLARQSRALRGAVVHLSCARDPRSPLAGYASTDGTALTTGVVCTITQRTRAGWRLNLHGAWAALAARSSLLTSVSVRVVAQVAVTVRPSGAAVLDGLTWGNERVAVH
jgi:hypothetical protein